MKSMRPFQIIILAVFAILALGGLVAFATFSGFNHAKPVGAVTIWGTLPLASVQTALDDVKRAHQEFTTLVYVERDPSTFDADLSDALASGSGPDLIITTQERLLSERNKLSVIPFSQISERNYRDTYLPIDDLFLTSNGFYGVPLAVDPLVLYYNRALLSSGGVSQPPTSWEAVVGLTPRLTVKGGSGQIGKSAIALGTYGNIPNARALVSLLLLQAGNPIAAANGDGSSRAALLSATNAAPSGVLPAEAAMSFYTQFADPAKTVYTWNRSLADARQSFISGDTALYVGFASERALIAASNPNLDFDMASVPQPQTASTAVDFGRAYAFAIPKAAKNASGALRAVYQLASPSEAALIVGPLGMAPAIRAQLRTAPNDLYAPVVYGEALIAAGWLSPAPAATDRIFAGMIESIISGRESVHDALAAANEALSAALQ